MSLTLYVGSRRTASWSLRAYLALAQSGAAHAVERILLDQPDTQARIKAVTAAGRVPVLHHDGLVVWDSLAICEYLAELCPDANLWPTDRAQRATARSMCAEMHAGFQALRTELPMELPVRRASPQLSDAARVDIDRVLAIWREALAASSGPFLFGAFTIADAFFAPVATRFVTYGIDVDITARSYIGAIYGLAPLQQWLAEAEREPQADA